jgi:hypothetical protein
MDKARKKYFILYIKISTLKLLNIIERQNNKERILIIVCVRVVLRTFLQFYFFAQFVIDNQCLCGKQTRFFAHFLRKNCALFAHVRNFEWVVLCCVLKTPP